jgi:hypothetical protein
MKHILFLAIFSFLLFKSYGQVTGIIKGKIIEHSTNQPVSGATVTIQNTNLGSISDTTGTFTIAAVPEGEHALVISYVGFQQKTINNIIVVRNKTYYLETELLNDPLSLKEVTVKNFKNENNLEMPVSSYSFSREEIFRNPGAQGDIFRAIGILPGVSSSGGQFSAIAVRGQGIRDNAYIVDDIPLLEVSHLEGSGSGFNDPNGGRFSIFAPKVIDNAVFQGGGFAAQYGRKGSSYLGLGIKEGNKETPSFSGQFDLLGATLVYDGPGYFDKKTSVFATARYQNFYLLSKLVGLKNVGLPVYGDYMVKTTSQLNKKNKLSILAMYNPESYEKTIDHVKESDKDNIEDVSIINTSNNKALFGLDLRTLTSKNSYWKNVVYYRTLRSKATLGTSSPRTDGDGGFADLNNIPYEADLRRIKNNQTELGYRSIFTQHIKNTTITGGVDFARVDVDYARALKHADTLYTFKATDIRLSPSQYYIILQPQNYNSLFKNFAYNTSVYLDLSFTILEKLTLNPGLRYDYTGFADQHRLSPRISGSLELNGTSSINFATGIYYQDPLLVDVADQPSANKLKNERTVQYILGYKNYFSSDLKLVVETYYKQLDDLTVRPFSGQTLLNNNGTGYAYGVDLNLTKRLSQNYYGQVGYSYMQSKRDDHDGQGEYNYTYSQPHIFSLLASYKPNDKWVFSTKFRYATGRPKDAYLIHDNVFSNANYYRYSQELIGKNKDRLNDFISFDTRADYRFHYKKMAVTTFIDIVNFLNRHNHSSENFQPITGRTYYDGLAIFPSFGLRIEL